MYIVKKLYNPEIFQGKYKKKNYFEGWYYKIIDSKMENSLAIIPGVSFDNKKEDIHAFIQVLNANKGSSQYLKYDISHFRYREDKFQLEIGENFFSREELRLHIDNETISIHGELFFENIIKYPTSIFKPGIMGPYSFVPFMECYHGIINVHHDIAGQLTLSGKEIEFNKGYGYIEKDWGRSFPESWVWIQSNHFGTDDVTLMFSVAKIPWLGRSFIGLISFIRIKNRIYHFATYNKSEIIKLDYKDKNIRIILESKKNKLEIDVNHSKGTLLKAPTNGLMEREILESIQAMVKVKLFNEKGQIIYEGKGTNTGLEMVGEIFST